MGGKRDEWPIRLYKKRGLIYLEPSVTLDPIGGKWCHVSSIRWARFAPARGDDNNNCIFITREYDSFGLKENGTIPFYRRFFDRINKIIKIQNLPARTHSVYSKFTRIRHGSYTQFTPKIHSVNSRFTRSIHSVNRWCTSLSHCPPPGPGNI